MTPRLDLASVGICKQKQVPSRDGIYPKNVLLYYFKLYMQCINMFKAAIKACEILKGRMEPIKLILLNPPWIDLVRACWILNMDLTATYQ